MPSGKINDDKRIVNRNKNNSKVAKEISAFRWLEIKTKKIINNNCIDNCNKDKIYKYEYNGIWVKYCPNEYYIDENNINKCKCELEKYLSCPPFALQNNLCTECNNSYYSIENDISNIGDYINSYKEQPKGYYLDKNDLL